MLLPLLFLATYTLLGDWWLLGRYIHDKFFSILLLNQLYKNTIT